jgi:chemotaxis protein methyltransferase CheR
VTDADLARFLASALPRLALRAAGFARVRRVVKKRLARRLAALGLRDIDAYAAHLAKHPEEWRWLDASCRIPISRFYRDRDLFDHVAGTLLPAHAARAAQRQCQSVRVWSAGCASGEEPYGIAIAWRCAVQPSHPDIALDVLATDADGHLLERARAALYPSGTLRELPAAFRAAAFEHDASSENPSGHGALYRLRDEFRQGVDFSLQDLRSTAPAGRFDLILCRNLAFTYFDAPLARAVAERLLERLAPGGHLLVGRAEALPSGCAGARELRPSVYERF